MNDRAEPASVLLAGVGNLNPSSTSSYTHTQHSNCVYGTILLAALAPFAPVCSVIRAVS